ncbi:MAG: response regulator [Acidimicrobiia bacterium]|nr:response regulator [Acidimicrobiia bacterium]
MGKTTLVVAAALTALMFGWQALHLYESQQAVAERDSGECPTRAVESAYSAGERLDYLTEEVEHSLFLWGANATQSPLPELGLRFEATSSELDVSLEQALSLSKGKVLAAVEQLDAAHAPLHGQVAEIMSLVSRSQPDLAAAQMSGSEFTSRRADYTVALDAMWTASREHLVVQLDKERRAEVLSVGVALVLFALAVGAWGLFVGQIRRSQARVEKEEQQRHRAEEDLLQAQKMDALGSMAGGIAHDFNNLVTAIWGSASSAKSQLPADHAVMPALERIEDASEQANGVVRALLAFSRRADSVKTPVEMGALIDSTAALLAPILPASVDLVIDHPADTDLWVMGDATQLQQSLMNLALNGHEAMPKGGRLVVRSWPCTESPEGPRIAGEVIDTGEGMTPELISRIFEPFFTTRAPGQGTGLGLAMIHGIVTDHGGRIRVESKPGKGTSVFIDLPAIDAPIGEVVGDAGSPVVDRVGGGLVLLVEDHQHVREIMAETLEVAGFEVLQATSGEEFLEGFEEAGDSIGLMIADVDIPPPSGIECIRRLRARGVAIPAIVITGTPAPGLEEAIGDLAVVLRKPFTMGRLVEVAAELVEGAPV